MRRWAQVDHLPHVATTLLRWQDSQKGVLLYVINSIEQHEQRECLLLYLLLLRDCTPEADASSGDLLEDATLAPPPPPQPAGTSADELQARIARSSESLFAPLLS